MSKPFQQLDLLKTHRIRVASYKTPGGMTMRKRFCEKCGGLDPDELTMECSNQSLGEREKELIKTGRLDYSDGKWFRKVTD